jgi:hypothetical protein
MLKTILLILLMLAGILSIGFGAWMAIGNHDGWGWFVFIGFIFILGATDVAMGVQDDV